MSQVGVQGSPGVRRPSQCNHHLCIMGLRFPLHLYRFRGGIQHYHVDRNRVTVDLLHGLHWFDHMETSSWTTSSSLEPCAREDGSSYQYCLPSLLRHSLRFCVLSIHTKSTTNRNELGHCCVWRCATLGLYVLHHSGKACLCRTGRMCQENNVKTGCAESEVG